MNFQNNIVTMNIKELDDLIYHAALRGSRRANKEFFNEIEPFFVKMNDDIEESALAQKSILKELIYLNMGGYEGEE